jgi:hypothetical protein
VKEREVRRGPSEERKESKGRGMGRGDGQEGKGREWRAGGREG